MPKKDGTPTKAELKKAEADLKKKDMAEAEALYKKYIHRKAFQELRQQVIERDGHRCMFCGRTEEELLKRNQYLQAHHLSYANLGKGGEEELKDLITCCQYCHRGCHSIVANKARFRDKRAILINIEK